MIFNSITFLIFLTVVVAAYWLLPQRGRQWLITLSSLTFYGFWRPEFTLVMLASATTDYFVALRMSAIEDDRIRRRWLYLSFLVNLGLLLVFKYLLFVVDNGLAVLRVFGLEIADPALNIILPLGISFYTFETISYSVDVYRRTIKAERDFLSYACFITYFPKLIAGPILRAHQLIPQLKRSTGWTLGCLTEGVRRIVIGLFLKVCLADNISPLVDDGFAQPVPTLSALDVWTLAFLFGYQIYFDFSAYSHIAIGCSRLMGIKLVENFNFPYTAVSPKDFWQRWHMSLSNWIRDYLYLPLMGTRPKTDGSTNQLVAGENVDSLGKTLSGTRRSTALFVTWSIMGLWHGANWTFLVWGLIHAVCIFCHRVTERLRARIPPWIRTGGGLAVTLPLMMAAWIPFRAPTLEQTWSLYGRLFDLDSYTWLGMRENNYLVAAVILVAVLLARPVDEYLIVAADSRPMSALVMNGLAFSLVAALVFIFLRPISQFIYFAF